MPLSISGSASLRRKLNSLGEVGRGQTLVRALVAGGLVIQNEGKRNAPYLTGNLRRSIHIGGHEDLNPEGGDVVQRTGEPVPSPEISGNNAAIYIGTDVEYALPVEYGTEIRPAQPYMRPAIDTTRSEVVREVAGALRDLVNAAAR